MSEPLFKLDENGNLVGPGLFVERAHIHHSPLIGKPVILLTVDQVNHLYEIGRQAGQLEEKTYLRRLRDRTNVVKIIDGPDPGE